MTSHPSIIVWKIPWTEEPGRLQSMGLQRVRHDLVTITMAHVFPMIRCSIRSHVGGTY